jgi:2-C-methyl-D-erythritol 2,4-cyclodiphosphate synthase
MYRTGIGFDAHRFGEGRKLVLGGVEFEGHPGLVGHSDADVLLHALTDALLGAGGLGDLGTHFPDTDAQWKGAASSVFLTEAYAFLRRSGWVLVNADLILIAQSPKIAGRREEICKSIAGILKVPPDVVSLKGTTTDHMGAIGRSEGIAAQAVVLIRRSDH